MAVWNPPAIGGPIAGGTAGSVLFVNPAGLFAQVAPEDDGDVLTLAGGLPVWAPPAGGGGGMAIGGAITGATEGSVLFAGAAGVLAQDNANFFWNDSANALQLGGSGALGGVLNAYRAVTGSVAGTGNKWAGIFKTELLNTDTHDGVVRALEADVTGGGLASNNNEVAALVASVTPAISGTWAATMIAKLAWKPAAGTFNDVFGLFGDYQAIGATVGTFYGLFFRDVTGIASTNYALYTLGGEWRCHTGAPAARGLTIKGAASQSGAPLTYQDNSDIVRAEINAAGAALFRPLDAVTNAATTALTIGHHSTGTPAAGFGSRTLYTLESSTTDNREAAALDVAWATATDASRAARAVWSVYDQSAAREALRLEASGTAAMIGFLGANAVARASAYTQNFATADKTHAARTAAALTDSVGGSVTTTVAAISNASGGNVSALVTQLNGTVLPEIRNALSSLLDQINKGRVDALDSSEALNAVIDDVQLFGLFA